MESVLKRMAVSGCLSDEENKIGERPGRTFLSGCSPRVLRGNGAKMYLSVLMISKIVEDEYYKLFQIIGFLISGKILKEFLPYCTDILEVSLI